MRWISPTQHSGGALGWTGPSSRKRVQGISELGMKTWDKTRAQPSPGWSVYVKYD